MTQQEKNNKLGRALFFYDLSKTVIMLVISLVWCIIDVFVLPNNLNNDEYAGLILVYWLFRVFSFIAAVVFLVGLCDTLDIDIRKYLKCRDENQSYDTPS